MQWWCVNDSTFVRGRDEGIGQIKEFDSLLKHSCDQNAEMERHETTNSPVSDGSCLDATPAPQNSMCLPPIFAAAMSKMFRLTPLSPTATIGGSGARQRPGVVPSRAATTPGPTKIDY